MRVIVIGGGVIGASVAYRLTRARVEVMLLEAGRVAGGTSAATFAWLNSNDKTPLEYHQLNADGMAEYSRLRQELEPAPWLHTDGNIEWAGDASGEAALRGKLARLRGWGYPAESLPIAALRDLEPELVAPESVTEFVFYPSEGYVDVPVMVGVLLKAAADAGAQIVARCRVTEMIWDRGRVRGVATANGIASMRILSRAAPARGPMRSRRWPASASLSPQPSDCLRSPIPRRWRFGASCTRPP